MLLINASIKGLGIKEAVSIIEEDFANKET
jgi:hypothetical protein